jgi:hypothetical protein
LTQQEETPSPKKPLFAGLGRVSAGKPDIQRVIDGAMEAPTMLNALKYFTSIKQIPDMFEDPVGLVGMKYQFHYNIFQRKPIGSMVLLVPDPANPHDANAVAVYAAMQEPNQDKGFTWIRVGYVPANSTHLFKDRSKVYQGSIHQKSYDFWTIDVTAIRLF